MRKLNVSVFIFHFKVVTMKCHVHKVSFILVCFDVYNLHGDGFISREEMLQMLKDSLIRQPTEEDPDEGIKDIVEIALKKMVLFIIKLTCNILPLFTKIINLFCQDYDHDGKVSYSDFEKTVKDENLLLQAFGNCLPEAKVVITSIYLCICM